MSVIFGLLFDLFYPCSEWQSMFFTRSTERKKQKKKNNTHHHHNNDNNSSNNNNKAATTKDKANKQIPPSKQQHQNTYKFCDALLFRRRTSLMTCIECIDEYRTVSILYHSWKSHVFLRAQDVVLQWLYIILVLHPDTDSCQQRLVIRGSSRGHRHRSRTYRGHWSWARSAIGV